MVLQPWKLHSAKLCGIDLLYKLGFEFEFELYVYSLGLRPSEQSHDFICNRAFRPCLSASIAQSAQIRSCQTPKKQSPETFHLPRSLPQMWRWSACRANSKIPRNQKGSCTQSSQMYKGWGSKAQDSFNHSLFCKEGKQCLHVLVDMIAAHHQHQQNHSVAISTHSLHDLPLPA